MLYNENHDIFLKIYVGETIREGRAAMGNGRKVFQCLTLILQFGLNMIVPIVMCTMLGVWLGKKYGISWI